MSIFLLASVLAAVLLGAISPGPSFVVVARIAISQSRKNGLFAALGMGVGGALFATLALLGLKALFASIPLLFNVLKLLGGMYLVYIGILMWCGAKQPLNMQSDEVTEQNTCQKAFTKALFIQVSNPKTAIFYSSIFAALLPQTVPLIIEILLPILVFCIESGWYCVVALLLSSNAPRLAYARSKVWLDRVAGGVMGLLGTKLIFSSATISV